MVSIQRSLLRLWRCCVILIGRDVYYPVQYWCPKEHHGSLKEGYTIALDGINRDSIVYSFGVGEDISFDLSLINKYGLNIYAFDPTPRAVQWIRSQKLPEKFHFFKFGVSNYDGVAEFNPFKSSKDPSYTILKKPETAHRSVEAKVYRLKTILKMLGHERIDILKMDIEGAEYSVIEELTTSDIIVRQILLEFHHRFRNVGVKKTKKAIESLCRKGYMIFDVSPNEGVYSLICPTGTQYMG